MTQYGFFFDQSRCIGCQGCAVLCKTWNDIQPGPVKWMRVLQSEQGNLTNVRLNIVAVPCYHCDNPVCVRACPAGAIHKEEHFGAVLVDGAACEALHREQDCRACWKACPYGAPQFSNDDPRATMSKCTMCVDRLYEGKKPVCVLACSLRALDFDTLDNLRAWYGPGDSLDALYTPPAIKPAAVFKKRAEKRDLIPWNASEALELWQKRGPFAAPSLPKVFEPLSSAIEVPEGFVRRDRCVLKPRTAEELTYYTSNDE